MMLVCKYPKEHIVGRTSLMIDDDTGRSYSALVFKKDAPADVIAEMREIDTFWRRENNNHPYFIFPDDPEYEKYLALIE